jgi:hypothetical protein
MLSQPTSGRFDTLSPPAARGLLLALLVIAIAGSILSWNRGNLPQRGPAVPPVPAGAEPAPQKVADDLQLYRDMVAAVQRGENYYVAAKPRLLAHGFPIHSTFNWRLPTYAWVFARLPGPWAIQTLLVLLAAAALAIHFQVELSTRGLPAALLVSFLLLGVVKWTVDGLAFYTQEIWAAVFILLSLGAFGKSALEKNRYRPLWQGMAVAFGLAALFFRELTLPYCCWAALLALYHRRWREAASWTVGIGLFFAFLAWHSRQVAAQLGPEDMVAAQGGISQWLKFGGLNFVLLTARLNAFLFAAPGPILFLYLLAALLGLASVRDERFVLQGLAAASYLAAFCIVGMELNFYWGLLYAPLLPAGVAAMPSAISRLWQRSGWGAS